MVDEIPVDPAITVFERMNIDKAERDHRRSDDRVQFLGPRVCKVDQAFHQGRQVIRPGAYVLGEGRSGVTVVRTHEAAFIAVAHVHETGIRNHEPLKAVQFIPAEGMAAGLGDRLTPALQPVLRRVFSFYREGGS